VSINSITLQVKEFNGRTTSRKAIAVVALSSSKQNAVKLIQLLLAAPEAMGGHGEGFG
jgi:hypothetical protein